MSDIEQRLQKLEDLFLDGEITEPTFKELRERLLARKTGGPGSDNGQGVNIADSVVKGDIRQTTSQAGGAVLGGGFNVMFGGGVPVASPQAMRIICAICGRRNPEDDTFRCRLCGRDHLCLEHLDKEHRCCDECLAMEVRKEVQRERERAAEAAERKRTEEEAQARREREAADEAERKRRAAPEELELDCGKGVKLKLRRIPAGSFMMGSEEDDDSQPVHRVTFKQPFYMGVYPVTQAQYEAVTGENPSNFSDESESPQHPVENVSWDDAKKFCQKLNGKLETANWKLGKVRLPSEAEWEYACRAGSTTEYCFGDDEGDLERYANFEYTPIYGDESTSPAGTYLPNAWDLYDMHGNVWEWCEDKGHDDYNGAPSDGSPWFSGGDSDRVYRGGSWHDSAGDCRAAYRGRFDPDYRGNFRGFRLALSPAVH